MYTGAADNFKAGQQTLEPQQ